MSILGTGIAAAVANTGQQAKQATAARSGREAQRDHGTRQTEAFTMSQLHDAGPARDADEEMPDQQAPGYEDVYTKDDGHGEPTSEDPLDQIHEADAPLSMPTGISGPLTYGPGSDTPLFHALDLTA